MAARTIHNEANESIEIKSRIVDLFVGILKEHPTGATIDDFAYEAGYSYRQTHRILKMLLQDRIIIKAGRQYPPYSRPGCPPILYSQNAESI